MKKFALVSLALVFVSNIAQADLILTSSSVTENFDGLPTTTVAGVFPATIGTQVAISGTGFVGTKAAGTGTTATGLTADTGALNSGGIYSYGAATVAERALGSLASAGNIMAYGVKIVNGTGSLVPDLTISFTQENWRSSTATVNTIAAAFAPTTLSGVTDSNFLTFAGFTPTTALDLVGPPFVTTNGALDGNDPLNQALRSFTFSGINLAAGDAIYLRWTDVNETGNDAGLAIDNFVVSTVAIPEPTAGLLVCGALGLAMIRRRVRKS